MPPWHEKNVVLGLLLNKNYIPQSFPTTSTANVPAYDGKYTAVFCNQLSMSALSNREIHFSKGIKLSTVELWAKVVQEGNSEVQYRLF